MEAKEAQPSEKYRDGIPRGESEGYCFIYIIKKKSRMNKQETEGSCPNLKNQNIRISYRVLYVSQFSDLEPIT